MTIKTEVMVTPDAAALSAVHRASFDTGWSPEDIAGMLEIEGTVAIVAEGGGGFAFLRHAGDNVDILTLAVLPAFRRSGIGKALVDALLTWAAARQARVITLEVRISNLAAQALYRKAGFKSLERLRGDYYRKADGSYEDALVLQYEL